MKTVLILSEPKQLVSLDALLEKWSGGGVAPGIVSLDAEIDFALLRREIPFVSGATLQNRISPAVYMRADEITKALCESKQLSFLVYRDISLMKPLRLTTHQYFQNLLYYVDVIERFMKSSPEVGRLVVPTLAIPRSSTSAPLAAEEARVVAEAARLVAEGRNICYEAHDISSVALELKNRREEFIFAIKRQLFGVGLALLNALMSLFPRKPLRLLVSDYWRNVAPILRELPEAELIFIDRGEVLNAGFSNIWRHKMRFVHISHFLSFMGRRRASACVEKCKEQWRGAREEVCSLIDLSFCGTNLTNTVQRVMNNLIENAVRDVVSDIEGSYAMYKKLSPNTVLLRASVSGQRHFAILPLVAQQLGIPALEVQHGGEYLGPGSPTQQHPAHFFAAYGKLVCDELRALGYEEERLLPVGSPRFDAYIKNRKEKVALVGKGISILSNTLNGNIGERYGTYSVEEYFKALGEAARVVPDSRLVVASRSNAAHGSFLKEARERGLHGVPYESVGTKPLPELFIEADIFVCSHSTVVYEALLYRLPVVVASFAPVERMMTDFHFSRFRDAGALAIAHTPEELRKIVGNLASDREARARMSTAGEVFMKEQFSFDGHASERIAAHVRAWAGIIN